MLDQLMIDLEGSAVRAAPRLPTIKYPGAGAVYPLWHGDACPGLSGLVAAINGIRLVMAESRALTGGEVDQLMRSGLRFLDGRLGLQQCVANGLRVQLWRQLVEAMAESARQRLGKRVSAERLYPGQRSRQAAFEALEDALARLRVPLMLCRGGHYTVVSGITETSLILMDSAGACWISKRVCGVPGDGDTLRHAIYPTSFMALSI